MKDDAIARIEQLSESDAGTALKRFYHIPVILALMGFMLFVRLQSLDRFRTNGEVSFRGNDPWYHFRETTYLLEHFPSTMPFDVMTNYPTGTTADQFGTIYDQLVAGAILLTSLGDPSPEHAGLVMLVAAPIFAVAAVVPTYLIAARFAGRGPALAGIAVLALLPGTFLSVTTAGFYDHHAAEVFFQTLGVLAFVVAISVAQRAQPVWELVVDRDLDALRRPLAYSAAAGVAAALYMWAWPPGVLLVGFTGVFFAVKLTSEVYHNRSPEPIAFVGAVSMTVTGLLMLLRTTRFTIGSPTSYTLLQVILPLGVAVGCVFLAFLAREWESRELSDASYPAAVGGLLLAVIGVVTVVLPGLASQVRGNLLGFVGFSATAGARTIGEATPPLARQPAFDFIYGEYRLALFTAILGALIILARPLIRSDDIRETGYVAAALGSVGLIYLGSGAIEWVAGLLGTSWQVLAILIAGGFLVGATLLHRYDGPELYLLVWGAFIISAGFTQSRFNYYLAVVVAVFTAIFIAEAISLINLRSVGDSLTTSARNLEGWQVMAIVTIVFLVVAPFVFPSVAAVDNGDRFAPGDVTVWEESLEWMNDETPTPGELGGADNALDPQGTYERPADDNYDYPEGAYGVQSWWDYGHWITVHGERIPNANPFQQGATEAANYLLAQNETAADDALAEKMGEDGETRYVMVDWKMVTPGSKFAAPTVFKDDVSRNDFVNQTYPIVQTDQGEQFGRPIVLRSQRYYDSQMVRLYAYHGSAADPAPIVVDAQERTVSNQQGEEFQVQAFDGESGIQQFETMAEAEAYLEENPSAQLGGIGDNPTERVDALEQYRLVKASSVNAARSSQQYQQTLLTTRERTNRAVSVGDQLRNTPSWVKTFEKVPGATIEGSGAPADTEVRASVAVEVPSTDRTFTYTQYADADANGNFEMRVPYSTTGYENFGPENGYTNASVQAVTDYQFVAGQQAVGSAEVTEAQVIGEDDSAVDVELSAAVAPQLGG